MKKVKEPRKRNPSNSNHKIHSQGEWNELMVNLRHGPLSVPILEDIKISIDQALEDNPRQLIIRFDPRFPEGVKFNDEGVISRFVDNLKRKIRQDQHRRKNSGKRTHPCRARVNWVREHDGSINPHYHCFLTVPLDCYFSRGNLRHLKEKENEEKQDQRVLVQIIEEAWAATLCCPLAEAKGLVHFAGKGGVFRINKNSQDFSGHYQTAFLAISYLAKIKTKEYGVQRRSFGSALL